MVLFNLWKSLKNLFFGPETEQHENNDIRGATAGFTTSSSNTRSYAYPGDFGTSSTARSYQSWPTVENQSIPPNAARIGTIRSVQEQFVFNSKKIDEKTANEFSQLYHNFTKQPDFTKKVTSVHHELGGYKHSDGLDFAAESWIWANRTKQARRIRRRPQLGQGFAFPSAKVTSIRAYYRVIAEKEDKYILMACHVNMHAFHRGDLRFVQVTDQTTAVGHESFSLVGSLYLGDVVAVQELRKIKGGPLEPPSVFKVNQETPCTWEVVRMTVLKRKINRNVTFAFLENGTAVVKGYNEAMQVIVESKKQVKMDKLFNGQAFVPSTLEYIFTEDFHDSKKNPLTAKASRIPSYPMATGTVFQFSHSAEETEWFHTGVDAFKNKKTSPEEKESTVEICALMGYSAANTVFNGRFDCRSFPMINPKREGLIVRFSIDNPLKQPTEGLWNCNKRLKFCGTGYDDFNGVIESVLVDPETKKLGITARMSRDTPKDVHFHDRLFIVAQRESFEVQLLNSNFFKTLSPESNGRRIIETLYGGKPIPRAKKSTVSTYQFPGSPSTPLNEYQNEYVRMILDKNPMVLGSSPFGCGKSMTIVTAALEVHKETCYLRTRPQQLLITQSNYASVNLVDIARKIDKDYTPRLKFLRYVSDNNWKELPDNCQTEYDLPFLMRKVFVEWATGRIGQEDKRLKQLETRDMRNMAEFVVDQKLVQPHQLSGKAHQLYDANRERRSNPKGTTYLVKPFLILYRPDVFMCTADTLQGLAPILRENRFTIGTIQIDEASQVPEYIIMNLLALYPNACFGLIGDVQQLPPYCEDELKGKLKEYGIGNTMERAIDGNLFPQAVLRYVYRCHPKTTDLLSELFYDGKLISGVTEDSRNEFMRTRPDIWPNPHFPIIIVDNKTAGYRMGTSTGNRAEAVLVQQIVAELTKKGRTGRHLLDPKDIGVISFYAAQTSVLTETLRGSGGVKCGTVDAFQGSEREVLIVCCTNKRLSDFMQLSNRLNVALSRSRQATIIVGSVDGMRATKKYWNTIVKRVEENKGLVDTTKHPWSLPASFKENRESSKNRRKNRAVSSRDSLTRPQPDLLSALNPDDFSDGSVCSLDDEELDLHMASLKL